MDIVRLGFRFSSFVIESEAGLINVRSGVVAGYSQSAP